MARDSPMNNPALKRLAKELKEIQQFKSKNREEPVNNLKSTETETDESQESSKNEPIEDDEDCIDAMPLKDDLFEWHFTLKGPLNSDFTGGLYHGRIIFPSDYPFSPPSISFLTPNGRWEVDKKICLSVTGFHPEMWQPAWGIRTILLALRDHFTVEDKAAIGYLDYPSKSRQELALKSQSWKCKGCPYDASQHFDTEASGAKRQRHVNENNNSNLLWNIGVILLIFSILFSYVYIYLI